MFGGDLNPITYSLSNPNGIASGGGGVKIDLPALYWSQILIFQNKD